MSRSQASLGSRRLPMGRRLLFATIAFGVALVVVIAGSELALRLAGWRAPGYYVDGRGPLDSRYVDQRGGPYPPGDGRLVGFSFDVAWEVNGDGFRERQRRPKRPGEYRIGLLGDSILAGFGVELEQRFADSWVQEVTRNRPEVTVWNLGASGAGTAQLVDVLNGVGTAYELDEIVLGLFAGNELEDDRDWEQRQAADPAKSQSTDGLARRLRDALRDHSRLALFLWLRGAYPLIHRIDPDPSPARDFPADGPVAMAALDRLAAAVGSRPLTIWWLPAREEWDEEHWRSMRDRWALDDHQRTAFRRQVADWAEERGVQFVDTTPFLAGLPAAAVKFPTDGHWHAGGHQAVATGLVAQAALDRGASNPVGAPPHP